MEFMFPTWKIQKGEKITLYGGGNCGKEFYMQVRAFQYCEVVVWVDRLFDYYEVLPPFDRLSNINQYAYDHVVIAIDSKEYSADAKNRLLQAGVPEEKIVWSPMYRVGHEFFPRNRVLYTQHLDFYMELMDDYINLDCDYAEYRDRYYHNYKELGLIGMRDNGERIAFYRLYDFLTKDSVVLDIGCNTGFFDLQMAPYVKEIVGVDVNEQFLAIAEKVRRFQKIENARFVCKDIFTEGIEGTYDAIFSMAMFMYVPDFEQRLPIIVDAVKPGGYLFFECSNARVYLERGDGIRKIIRSLNMKELIHQNSSAESDRDIFIFQKPD